jgi:hypothetical protein
MKFSEYLMTFLSLSLPCPFHQLSPEFRQDTYWQTLLSEKVEIAVD